MIAYWLFIFSNQKQCKFVDKINGKLYTDKEYRTSFV